jgi:hypothetical protein
VTIPSSGYGYRRRRGRKGENQNVVPLGKGISKMSSLLISLDLLDPRISRKSKAKNCLFILKPVFLNQAQVGKLFLIYIFILDLFKLDFYLLSITKNFSAWTKVHATHN